MAAEMPHSRCSGSPLNRATPPPNRAQPSSPAASQTRGMVRTDCQPEDATAASPPPAPVVGASARGSRLHTRYILPAAPSAACLYLWSGAWQAKTTTEGGRWLMGGVEPGGLLRGKAAIITGGE